MGKLSPRRLKQKPFILVTSILALSGWCAAFGGACVLKVLNGAWWIIIYQLCITLGHIFVFMSGSMQHYRLAMMTILASSIPLLTIQIDYVVQYTKSNLPKMPANAYVAGYIILVTVQYMWVFVIGSESHTRLGRLGHITDEEESSATIAGTEGTGGAFEPEFYSEKMMQQSSLPNSAILGGPNNRMLNPTQSTPSVHTIAAQKVSILVEYIEKVQALHAYKASIQDPNELSFEKGEILEVVDRKGNWWQARKSNGAIGIIPSNYFAQP